MTKAAEWRLPLFYRDPRLLISVLHDDVRLKGGDYDFAKETNATPLTVIEFAAALRHYPIVFSENDGFPVAVLGLERANRFVAEGRWVEDAYVPAYVRRYPFVFAESDADSFALALDMGSDRVTRGGTDGEPLFESGKPTALTEGAMAFCREFHGAHIQTQAFVDALIAQDLLTAHHADARLASGKPMTLSGFKVVDRAKFEALDDALVLEWHRKGWLALVHFHFVSLDRFTDLVAREGSVELPSAPEASAPIDSIAADDSAPFEKEAV
jgi:hypothetical protein